MLATPPQASVAPFEHTTHAQRVLFGVGKFAAVADEAKMLGFDSPLIIATPGRRAFGQTICDAIPGSTLFAEAQMHAPDEVVAAAGTIAEQRGADGLISCGGGSALGIAKALAHQLQVRILAVATTYSGSEATPRWSVTRDGAKQGGIDPIVLPATVVYDPELSVSLPRAVSAPSGMNAMAHAVAALYDPATSPINRVLALDALSRLSRALPAIEADPGDLAARGDALVGSYLCGTVMPASLGVHHRCAHVLGGGYCLPHAEVHTVLLPYTTTYNAGANTLVDKAIAHAVGGHDHPGGALYGLIRRLSVPASLEALGLAQRDLGEAAGRIAGSAAAGPQLVDQPAVHNMLERAFAGLPPINT